ncbi:MAG TPA: thioesterase family protein [Terriglobales bacterium]|nr:thioesterase family protein [Terriglobales bacterium]
MTKTPYVGEARIRVRYAETDQMRVVYHSNYVIWFEVGRVELLRQIGFTYKEMEAEDHCHIAVVDLKVRYKAPALYDDELIIRTHLKNVRSWMLHFGYEVVRASDGSVLAEGETTHIVVGDDLQRKNLPEKYLVPFRAAVVASL